MVSMLVADDDEIHRTLVSQRLRALGHEVQEVDNGNDALKALDQPSAPRMAIVDWNMPGISGPDLCTYVRDESDLRPYTYLILLTVRDQIDDIRQGLSAGADDYLTKPCHPAELEARIDVGLRMIESNDTLNTAVEDLQSANELLSAFSRTLAHDLRGSLTSVDGYAYLLSENPELSDDSHDLLQSIVDASIRMRAIVDDVLILETASRQVEKSTFNFFEAIADAKADVQNLEVTINEVPGTITAHRSSFVRSLKNLFENATRYGRKEGVQQANVIVSVQNNPDDWTITVQDQGLGVTDYEREHIFESFTRGTRSKGTNGTGLGLAIVAACARAHDGKVWVDNAPTGGACFHLKLAKPAAILQLNP